MALKAEGAAPLDCFEVTLKCEDDEDEDDDAVVVAVIPRPEPGPARSVALQDKAPTPRPGPVEAANSYEEPKEQMTWEQEFLVGNSPGGSGRALCMVCGAVIRAPSADTARAHIIEEHPHTLDLSLAEKSNILEAWSEGVALLQDVGAEQQPASPKPDLSPASSPDSGPNPTKMPAEIVVLLDSEDNPTLPKRVRPRGLRPLELLVPPAPEPGAKKARGQRWKESPEEEPVRKKRSQTTSKTLDLSPDSDLPSPDSPEESFEAPIEVRHFTEGTFPQDFALRLFSHSHIWATHNREQPKEQGVPRPTGGPVPELLLRDKSRPGRSEADTADPQRRCVHVEEGGHDAGIQQGQSEEKRGDPLPVLRGTLDLQLFRVCLENPPATHLLPDWPKHRASAKAVGPGDPANWPVMLPESSTSAEGPP